MSASQARIERGYARHKKDAERLRASGVKTIYRADEDETLEAISLRDDVDLIVCDGFRALGKTGEEIEAAINLIHEKGARVVTLDRQRNSRDHGIKLMREAMDAYRPSPEAAAHARAAKKPPVRIGEREARVGGHESSGDAPRVAGRADDTDPQPVHALGAAI